jgi:hypothetical protein
MAHNKLKRLVDGDDKLKLTLGQILAGNSSDFASAVSLTGAVTLGSAGSVMFANASITSAHINTGAVTSTKLGASAVTAGKIRYDLLSITFLVSEASTTSAVKTQAFTTGAILAGIYLAEWASITDRTNSWAWKASINAGTVTITLNNSNPGEVGGKYVFKGVVIEP